MVFAAVLAVSWAMISRTARVVASAFASSRDLGDLKTPSNLAVRAIVSLLQKKGRASPTFFQKMILASTSVVKDRWHDKSCSLQISGSTLSVAAVFHDLELQFLAFGQRGHSGLFDRRNVYEPVGLAIVLLDEAEAFRSIEELHSSRVHDDTFQIGNEIDTWLKAKALQHDVETEDRQGAFAQNKIRKQDRCSMYGTGLCSYHVGAPASKSLLETHRDRMVRIIVERMPSVCSMPRPFRRPRSMPLRSLHRAMCCRP
jgi:hypothetical protein